MAQGAEPTAKLLVMTCVCDLDPKYHKEYIGERYPYWFCLSKGKGTPILDAVRLHGGVVMVATVRSLAEGEYDLVGAVKLWGCKGVLLDRGLPWGEHILQFSHRRRLLNISCVELELVKELMEVVIVDPATAPKV